MMPFFSIIIPTYNRSNVIFDTILSVQNQIYKFWECIIVDDGSIDNTAEIVNSISKLDNRIKYLYQANAERSNARNNGINNAIGEYICFLDSDDYYLSNHLEVLKKNIEQNDNPKGLFFVDHLMLSEGVESKVQSAKYNNSIEYFVQNSTIPVRVCIHKDILKTHQFDPRIVIVEDSVLWTQIALKFPIYHIQEHSVVYRWHDDNSVNIKNNCFLPRLKGLKILFSDEELKKVYSQRKQKIAISNCYYGIAKHYAFQRNFIKMVYNIGISLLLDLKCKQNKAKIYMIYEYFR
jgi:glycosyltransferase involved in cell wall biosynthesis